MLHRILDERLQNHWRHERVAKRRVGVDRRYEPALKPDAEDLEIPLDRAELAGERDFGFGRRLERAAQQLAQSSDHAAHALGIAIDERGDRVQCVEQEMWIELALQDREPGLGKLGAQPCRFLEPALVAAHVVTRDSAGEHAEREHDVVDVPEPDEEPEPTLAAARPARPRQRQQCSTNDFDEHVDREGDDDGDGDVEQDSPHSAAYVGAEPAREPEQGRRRDHPQDRLDHADRHEARRHGRPVPTWRKDQIGDAECTEDEPERSDPRQLAAGWPMADRQVVFVEAERVGHGLKYGTRRTGGLQRAVPAGTWACRWEHRCGRHHARRTCGRP